MDRAWARMRNYGMMGNSKSTLVTAIPLVAALLGCGMFGTALSMQKTNIAADKDNYAKLEAAAQKLGWKTERAKGSSDWDLVVHPKDGGKIMMNENYELKVIAFNCEGGALDDSDKCRAKMNELLQPLGYKLED